MVKIVSVINLKGGVGKTTTTVALADALSAKFGKKVLVIDLDPQTNATLMLIGEQRWKALNDEGRTLATLFRDQIDGSDKFTLPPTLQKGVSNVAAATTIDLLPSSIDLVEIQEDLSLTPVTKLKNQSLVDILRNATARLVKQYDYVLLDAPPSLGVITRNGLRMSDAYLIPAVPDYLSTYGIPQIIRSVRTFAEEVGLHIAPLGLVATRVSQMMPAHKAMLQLLRTRAKEEPDKWPPVFTEHYPQGNSFANAAQASIKHSSLNSKYGPLGRLKVELVAREFIKRAEAL